MDKNLEKLNEANDILEINKQQKKFYNSQATDSAAINQQLKLWHRIHGELCAR